MRWSQVPQEDKAEAAIVLIIYIPLTACLVLQLLSQRFRLQHRAQVLRHRGQGGDSDPSRPHLTYKRKLDGDIQRTLRLSMLVASLLQLVRLVRLTGREGWSLFIAELARNASIAILLCSYMYTLYVTASVAYKSRGQDAAGTFVALFWATLALSVIMPITTAILVFELNRVYPRAINMVFYMSVETLWLSYCYFVVYRQLKSVLRIKQDIRGTSKDPLLSLRRFMIVTWCLWIIAVPTQVVRLVSYLNAREEGTELSVSPEEATYDVREGLSILVQTIATISLAYYSGGPFTILACERHRGLQGASAVYITAGGSANGYVVGAQAAATYTSTSDSIQP